MCDQQRGSSLAVVILLYTEAPPAGSGNGSVHGLTKFLKASVSFVVLSELL